MSFRSGTAIEHDPSFLALSFQDSRQLGLVPCDEARAFFSTKFALPICNHMFKFPFPCPDLFHPSNHLFFPSLLASMLARLLSITSIPLPLFSPRSSVRVSLQRTKMYKNFAHIPLAYLSLPSCLFLIAQPSPVKYLPNHILPLSPLTHTDLRCRIYVHEYSTCTLIQYLHTTSKTPPLPSFPYPRNMPALFFLLVN